MESPILITGATGFIGGRLAKRLAHEGKTLQALVLPTENAQALERLGIKIIRGDIGELRDVERAFEGVKTVFHLAAMVGDWNTRQQVERVTIQGTTHILECASVQGARAVLVSSVVVYGDKLPHHVCDEDLSFGNPLGLYSWSKQSQEQIARRLEQDANLKVSIVRPTNVYGWGSRPWVDLVVTQIKQGLPILIGNGDQNAALCHVDNVVDVCIRASTSHKAIGRAYNVHDNNGITWKRYFGDLAQLCGTKPRSIPPSLAHVSANVLEWAWRTFKLKARPPITREALNLVGSDHQVPITRAKQELGYVPLMPYTDALREISDYLRSQASPN